MNCEKITQFTPSCKRYCKRLQGREKICLRRPGMPLASGAHSRIFAWRADAHAVLLLTVIATVLTPAALAQYRASIQGTVTDSSGAIIPGATLTLTDIGTAKAQ